MYIILIQNLYVEENTIKCHNPKCENKVFRGNGIIKNSLCYCSKKCSEEPIIPPTSPVITKEIIIESKEDKKSKIKDIKPTRLHSKKSNDNTDKKPSPPKTESIIF